MQIACDNNCGSVGTAPLGTLPPGWVEVKGCETSQGNMDRLERAAKVDRWESDAKMYFSIPYNYDLAFCSRHCAGRYLLRGEPTGKTERLDTRPENDAADRALLG